MWAMCAIDALGIAPMLDRAVTIDTSDPVSGDRITVQIKPTGTARASAGAVVFLGRRGAEGPAEKVCCDAINIFSSAHSAARWAAPHPDVLGEVLDLDDAAQLGRAILSGLLRGGPISFSE